MNISSVVPSHLAFESSTDGRVQIPKRSRIDAITPLKGCSTVAKTRR